MHAWSVYKIRTESQDIYLFELDFIHHYTIGYMGRLTVVFLMQRYTTYR